MLGTIVVAVVPAVLYKLLVSHLCLYQDNADLPGPETVALLDKEEHHQEHLLEPQQAWMLTTPSSALRPQNAG